MGTQLAVFAKKILVLLVGPALLGGACLAARAPEAYGKELESCVVASKLWADYEPCCIDVARRYHRDPSFCLDQP